jgi:hypothetical protein
MNCNVMSQAGRKRKGKNDNLVPVTFPLKEAFSRNQIGLKPLLASLEVWRDSNEIFGMPKGGLGKKSDTISSKLARMLDSCAPWRARTTRRQQK